MQSFDPIYLQRLVDGELDRDETRMMLELAENNPVLWREMASAFTENQLWESGFRKLDMGIEPETKKASRANTNAELPLHRFRWFAIAAAMMVALTAGLMIGQFSQSKPALTDTGTEFDQNGPLAMVAPADRPPTLEDTTPPNRTLVNYQPDYHLELEDINGNPVFDTEVPLYSSLTKATEAGYKIDRQPSLPAELVESVVKRGYWVNQNVNYVSGRLDDGRMFVVPVRTINLVRGQ